MHYCWTFLPWKWQHWETSESWQLRQGKQKNPRNSQSQDISVSGINEEYNTQDVEKIEGRVTRKRSQEFNKTKSCILWALSKLHEILLNTRIQILSGIVPGTFWNTDSENQEPSGDCFQNDPYPDVEFSACRTSNWFDSNPEEISHNDFLNETHVHRRFFNFWCIFAIMGIWLCTCKRYPCECHWPRHKQRRVHKSLTRSFWIC